MEQPSNNVALEDRHADDLHCSWQGKVVLNSHGFVRAAVLSMLAHYYDAMAVDVLLRALFTSYRGMRTPFICSAAKINKYGRIIVDVQMRDWEDPTKDFMIFNDIDEMRDQLRKLADRCKLTDAERCEFILVVASRWLVADQRLDPTFDPKDPDARRLTLN